MQAEITKATTTESKPNFMVATRSCAPLRPQRCGLNVEFSKWSPLRKSNKTAIDQDAATATLPEKWTFVLSFRQNILSTIHHVPVLETSPSLSV